AASQTNELINIITSGNLDTINLGQQLVPRVAQQLRERNFILRPSLASLALGVILYYQGIQYKGFFTEFTMTESIGKLGLFDYNMTFMSTEIRGQRENFMPWHREPLADDPTGQLVNAMVSLAGNAVRKLAGLAPQQVAPEQFHPESAPLTFGGNSFSSQFGMEATGPTEPASIR
ncbi:hypothetical protein LCGC14_1408070, partial [marine sediment metagenome]